MSSEALRRGCSSRTVSWGLSWRWLYPFAGVARSSGREFQRADDGRDLILLFRTQSSAQQSGGRHVVGLTRRADTCSSFRYAGARPCSALSTRSLSLQSGRRWAGSQCSSSRMMADIWSYVPMQAGDYPRCRRSVWRWIGLYCQGSRCCSSHACTASRSVLFHNYMPRT